LTSEIADGVQAGILEEVHNACHAHGDSGTGVGKMR